MYVFDSIRYFTFLSSSVILNLHSIIVKERITPGMTQAAIVDLKAVLDLTRKVKVVPVTVRLMSHHRVHPLR